MREVTERDAVDAAHAVDAFWAALADDDDLALLRVLDDTARNDVGTKPGICRRFRERLVVSTDECRTVGIGSKVRVMSGGPMVFLCMRLDASKPKLVGTWGPEQIQGWALAVALEGGFWRVTGRYEGEQWPEATQYLDLPWAPSTGPSH